MKSPKKSDNEGKDANDSFVNCYCKCRILEEKLELIGFNSEKIKFDYNDLPKDILKKNNTIYYLQNLKKEEDAFVFIKDNSSISEFGGIALKDNVGNINEFNPYSFTGKIVKKGNNQILFLSPLNEIILLTNIKEEFNKLNDLEENIYVTILFAKFISKTEGVITFELVKDFSSFNIHDKKYEDDEIYKKIALQFNILDYNENKDNVVGQFGIELPDKNIKKIKPNRDTIFYIYEVNENEAFYFPQKIYFYDNNNKYLNIDLKYFAYKASLTEANLYIKQKCFFAYELLYFSLDNNLPKEIEIEQHGKIIKYDKFSTFGSTIRKSIVFLNIPPQNPKDEKENENSFLKVFICTKDEMKLYGTFCLNSIQIKTKKYYQYNPLIKENIINIYDDFIKCFIDKKESPTYLGQYLTFNKKIIKSLEDELFQKSFHLYEYENNEFLLKYFNSLCFWNLFHFLKSKKYNLNYLNDYKCIYERIIKRPDLNYIQQSLILVSFLLRLFEDTKSFKSPLLFFYDELDNNNPYKVAYNFQYDIIENLKENSCLFQPFLFLDSYIMKCIRYKEFSFIKPNNIPAYSFSMLNINLIKKHLQCSINNCFFVLKKEGSKNKRNYYASVNKFNGIITYNENLLLEDSNYKNMYKLDDLDILNEPNIINNYAFVLNLENLHESFSHNKEHIVNFQESSTLYINRNLKSEIYDCNSKDYGEDGKLVESFIGPTKLVEELQKIKFEMGNFLKINYFIDKDFSKLVREFYIRAKDFNLPENDLNEMFPELLKKNNIKNNELNKLNDKTDNSPKKGNMVHDDKFDIEKIFQDENENKIFLSKHNTYIVTGETFEELMENAEKARKKIFIKAKHQIEQNNDVCDY